MPTSTTSSSSSSSSSAHAPSSTTLVAPLATTTASKKATKPPAKASAAAKLTKATSKASILVEPVTNKRKVIIEIEDSDNDDDEDEENVQAVVNIPNLPTRQSSSNSHAVKKTTRTSSLPVYNDSEPVGSHSSSSRRGPFSATSTSPFTSSHRSSGRLSAVAAAPITTTAASSIPAARRSSRLSTSPAKTHITPTLQLSLGVLQGPHKDTTFTLPITVGDSSTSANIAKYKGQSYDSRIFGRENDFPSDDTVSSRYIHVYSIFTHSYVCI